MSLLPPPDDWIIEEPPDLYFPESALEEPPDWDFETTLPPEPPDLLPDEDAGVLMRLERYAAPAIPSAYEYPLPAEVYADEPLGLPPEVYAVQGLPSDASENRQIERDSSWRLQHTGILIEEVFGDNATLESVPDHYAVGLVEVWQDAQTGDLSGVYLALAEAPHRERAEQMRSNIYRLADEAGVADPDLGDFAHGLIKHRGEWQAMSEAQWEVVDVALSPDTPEFQDEATWAARDRLLAQVFETLEPEANRLPNYDQAVKELGLHIEGFDPNTTPPPLFDAKTNTAYWVGVYQDPETPDQGITSLLSIQMDENDVPQARLAPVAMGDLDHAQRTAEYLLKVAERTQDVGQVLDAAEGMAVATQHRELWDSTQGISVEQDIRFSPLGMEIS